MVQVNSHTICAKPKTERQNNTLQLNNKDLQRTGINLNLQPSAQLNKIAFTGALSKVEPAGVFVDKFLQTESPIESAKLLTQRYPELNWLTGSVNATPEGVSKASNSVSESLFGTQHTEFDRTLVGIESLKWVLNGDYDKFTGCQKDSVKLTPENFDHLRTYTQNVLQNPEDIDAMIGYTVINDLGKIKSVVSNIQEKTGIKSVDHDDVLLYALKHTPEEVPTFKRLSNDKQDTIIKSLEPQFNIGQFLQAENLPANLSGLKNLDSRAMDYYLVHAVYDIAGAAGHVNPKGSLVMANPLYEGFKQGINAMKGLARGESEVDVYNGFIKSKAKAIDLQFKTPQDKAIAKLAVLSRAGTPEEGQTVKQAFNQLSQENREVLTSNLNKTGIDDRGTLLYYAPAFIQNLKGASKEEPVAVLSKGFSILADIYKKADEITDKTQGVFTVLISDVAKIAKESPERLLPQDISLRPVGENAEAVVIESK